MRRSTSRTRVKTTVERTWYCDCQKCLCRRDVTEKGDLCRHCSSNLHDGKPRRSYGQGDPLVN